jgi:hypothetical protein
MNSAICCGTVVTGYFVQELYSYFIHIHSTSERAQLKNFGLPSAVRTRDMFS